MKKPHHTLIERNFITGFDAIVNDSDERTRYCFSTAKFIKIAILTGLGHLVWLHNIQRFTFNTKPLSNQTFHWTLLCVRVCMDVKERDRVWYDLWRRDLCLWVISWSLLLWRMFDGITAKCFFFFLSQMLKLFPNGREIERLNTEPFRVCYCKTAWNRSQLGKGVAQTLRVHWCNIVNMFQLSNNNRFYYMEHLQSDLFLIFFTVIYSGQNP